MIPRTYPSRVNSTTGRVEALVSFISSTTGLQRWVDYTPVAFVTDATPVEGSYNNNGYIAVADVGSTAGLQAGKDYIRVYLDPNATDAWRVNSVGFIPVGYSGIGGIPYALFANNEQGVWYDPSDRTTLFQDSAGTTPVTAVEQPVGLMLDKSKGLVLGSELVTNGDFSNGTTGWVSGTVNTTLTAVSGELRAERTGTSSINAGVASQSLPTAANVWYAVTLEVYSPNYTGSLRASFANAAAAQGTGTATTTFAISATKRRYTVYLSSTGLSFFTLHTVESFNTGHVIFFDNISVRELPGNHAFQTTSTSRPVLSARYNLLTKTEQMSVSPWATLNATVAGGFAAPDGSTNAARLTGSGVSAAQRLFQNSVVPAANFVAQYKAKAGTHRYIQMHTNIDVQHFANFDLQTGTVGTVGTKSVASISADPTAAGWFICTVSFQNTTAGNFFTNLVDSNSAGYGAASATSGYVDLWGADLRVTNDAAGQPAYQRVNTATDYDTTGFKPYLRFDGTDDWLQTNSINFTGTDKMTVFAGVRKLSDAAAGTLAELSSAVSTNPGSFLLRAPRTAAANYMFSGGGTSYVEAASTSNYTAPITSVLTGVGDIAGDSAILRIDGAQAAFSTADQGTGNYGNYPLYIGRRGGTTLPFNGRIYGLIVRGAATTTATIQATETYMNGKTGAY